MLHFVKQKGVLKKERNLFMAYNKLGAGGWGSLGCLQTSNPVLQPLSYSPASGTA